MNRDIYHQCFSLAMVRNQRIEGLINCTQGFLRELASPKVSDAVKRVRYVLCIPGYGAGSNENGEKSTVSSLGGRSVGKTGAEA